MLFDANCDLPNRQKIRNVEYEAGDGKMHFKPEEIPLITPENSGGGCMRSIKAGEMEIGFTWTTGPRDYTSLYEGLPGGVCPCDHYGYIFSGRICARYADGREEVIGPGEVYYIPKGHVLIYEEATHHLEINPHRELQELMAVILRNGTKLEQQG
jgi:hypothetical protein